MKVHYFDELKLRYGKLLGDHYKMYDVSTIPIPQHFKSTKNYRASNQSVVVKMNYTKPEMLKNVLTYMTRESAQSLYKQELFTSDGEVQRKDIQPIEKEQKIYRLMLSPQHGDILNLKTYTKLFMDKLSRETGFNLDWAAIEHHNTANPHVHVLIRGIDNEQRSVFFNKSVFKHKLRSLGKEAAEEILDFNLYHVKSQKVENIQKLEFLDIDKKIIDKRLFQELTAIEKKRVGVLYQYGLITKHKRKFVINDYTSLLQSIHPSTQIEVQHEKIN